MRVKLLRDARITHKAGEIVEVSSTEFQFLVSVGSAVEVAVNPSAKVETATKEPTKAVEREQRKNEVIDSCSNIRLHELSVR